MPSLSEELQNAAKRRGRPPVYHSDEERSQALMNSRAKSRNRAKAHGLAAAVLRQRYPHEYQELYQAAIEEMAV